MKIRIKAIKETKSAEEALEIYDELSERAFEISYTILEDVPSEKNPAKIEVRESKITGEELEKLAMIK